MDGLEFKAPCGLAHEAPSSELAGTAVPCSRSAGLPLAQSDMTSSVKGFSHLPECLCACVFMNMVPQDGSCGLGPGLRGGVFT